MNRAIDIKTNQTINKPKQSKKSVVYLSFDTIKNYNSCNNKLSLLLESIEPKLRIYTLKSINEAVEKYEKIGMLYPIDLIYKVDEQSLPEHFIQLNEQHLENGEKFCIITRNIILSPEGFVNNQICMSSDNFEWSDLYLATKILL